MGRIFKWKEGDKEMIGIILMTATGIATGISGIKCYLENQEHKKRFSQMEDNVSYMKDFVPLNELELKALNEVSKRFNALDLIQCTGCRYCVDGCPKQIRIPRMFSLMNNSIIFSNIDNKDQYAWIIKDLGKASDCIKCGKCEQICPQHLPIRKLLEEVAIKYE